MDEADQGPGPRDPEIPQQTTDEDAPRPGASSATGDPDWTRNLTTIAVVPRRQRPAVERTVGVQRGHLEEPDPEAPAPEPAPAEPAAEVASEVAVDPVAPDTALLVRVHALLSQDEPALVQRPPGADDGEAPAAGLPRRGAADAAAEGVGISTETETETEADGASDVVAALLAPFEDAAPGGADTALRKPVDGEAAAETGDPDTALLKPVAADPLDAWVASLGARPAELAEKAPETDGDDASGGGGGGDDGDDGDDDKETVPSRRRFINPWLGSAGVVVLLLAGAMTIQNPFTMATSERVPQSDVQRLSDPEPPVDSGPVNGGLPANLELPPVVPAAAPGVSTPASAPPSPASTVPFTPTAAQTPASSVTGANGIPQMVLTAYRQAADYTAKADTNCRLRWELLAAIGRVESGHANGGQVSTNGTALTPILGPRLDGSSSTKAIRDTDQGTLDYDREFDRAVGPMQFIPSSWRVYAMDGNKDAKKDPQNVFDASLTAARYLCAGERDLSTADGLDRAIFSYNQSPEYVRSVKAWMQFYIAGVRPIPQAAPPASSAPPAASSKAPTPSSAPPKSSSSVKPTTSSAKPGG